MSLLASIYATLGADLSQLDRQFATAIQKGTKAGSDTGRAYLNAIKQSLASGAAFGNGGITTALGLEGAGTLLDQLKGQLLDIGRAGGIDYAAQIQKQERAYTRLFGSAKMARDVIAEVEKNSLATGVSALETLDNLRKFTALPVSPMERVRINQTATDTASAYGMAGGERRRLVDNIGDIFGNGFDRAQSNQFQMLGINVEKTLGLGLGKKFKNESEALAAVKGMSPVEQGNAFIRGLEKQFGGMSEEIASSTFLGRLSQANVLFEQAGKSSGKLALQGLTPLMGGLLGVGGAVKWLNDATGGGAGLAVMAGAAGVALYSTVKTGMTAVQTLYLLNQQLQRLATNSTTAAGASAAQGGLGFLGGGAAAGGKGLLGRLAARFPALAGFGAKAAGVGGKLAGLAGKANVTGLALLAGQIGLGAYAANMKDGKTKARLSAVADESGKWGLYGAIAGAILGSVVPGLGTMAGIGIGGAVGGLAGAAYGGFKPLDPQATAANDLSQAAKELSGAAGAIKQISSVGGGSRVSSVLNSLESAYALQGAF